MADARCWILLTTACTSSAARTGVTGSSTSLCSAALARGTLPWISNSSAASRKKPARVQKLSTSGLVGTVRDRKSTRLNSSHLVISYAVFCLKKKKKKMNKFVLFHELRYDTNTSEMLP